MNMSVIDVSLFPKFTFLIFRITKLSVGSVVQFWAGLPVCSEKCYLWVQVVTSHSEGSSSPNPEQPWVGWWGGRQRALVPVIFIAQPFGKREQHAPFDLDGWWAKICSAGEPSWNEVWQCSSFAQDHCADLEIVVVQNVYFCPQVQCA